MGVAVTAAPALLLLDDSEAFLRGARGVDGDPAVAVVGVVTAVPLPALLDDNVLRLDGVVALVRLLELPEDERLLQWGKNQHNYSINP